MNFKRFFIFIFLFIFFGELFFCPIFFTNNKVRADRINTSVSVAITVCGNNIKEGSEDCDGTDLSSQTCIRKGYVGGTLACNTNCTFNTSNCTSGGGGGGGGGGESQAQTKVVIQGLASPGAEITILQNGNIVKTIKSNNLANFSTEITDITPGVWTFSLWATDNKGIKSISYGFTVNISSNVTTTISNIFLPPTINLIFDQVKQGEIVSILGQTAPNSKVTITINSQEPMIEKVQANAVGVYFYNLNTASLEVGNHYVKSMAENSNLMTNFSQTLSLQVINRDSVKPNQLRSNQCSVANLNCDINNKKQEKVDFVDVSILLYNWGKPKNSKADLNGDGVVNYQDLSILLYYWTG